MAMNGSQIHTQKSVTLTNKTCLWSQSFLFGVETSNWFHCLESTKICIKHVINVASSWLKWKFEV